MKSKAWLNTIDTRFMANLYQLMQRISLKIRSTASSLSKQSFIASTIIIKCLLNHKKPKSSKNEKNSCSPPRPLRHSPIETLLQPPPLPVSLLELSISLTLNPVNLTRQRFLVDSHSSFVCREYEAGRIGQPHQPHG